MKIERIELHEIAQPMIVPFRTSFGVQAERPCILVQINAEGMEGWGECVTFQDPGYSYECIDTAWLILNRYLAPVLLGQQVEHPRQVIGLFDGIRGHPMAKAGVELACWDLFARTQQLPLHAVLGGVRQHVEVGISIGIEPTIQRQIDAVDRFIQQGYRRIKVKIEPGWDIVPLTAIRERHPDIQLMVDANSAYTLDDVPLFVQLDALNLLMIEQPLHHDDMLDHARLQEQVRTPICLDESIHAPRHARWALALKACRILNMKVGRVGGMNHALQIHDLCQQARMPMWCGGMFETGVGRAINLHLASLPNFVLPGDIPATGRHYHEDVSEPALTLNPKDSTIAVPDGPGIGVNVIPQRLQKYRRRHAVMKT